jgi:hypothetical protein
MKVQCAKPKVEIIPVMSSAKMNSWFTKEGTLSSVQPARSNSKYAKGGKHYNQIALPLF